MPGWASPARPAVYKPPVGARVASPQSPILRWSTPKVSALDWATSGLSKSPLLIARPLLLTTNCPLLLTTAVRFCSHRDTSSLCRACGGVRHPRVINHGDDAHRALADRSGGDQHAKCRKGTIA